MHWDWPIYLLPFIIAVSNFAYAVEWNLFAVYFSDQYEWQASLSGFAQMAGDALGALILYFFRGYGSTAASEKGNTTKATPDHPESLNQTRRGSISVYILKSLLRPPFNLGSCIAIFGILFVLFTVPTFVVVTVAQVAMGTIYVLIQTGVNELSVLYSFGNSTLFGNIAVRTNQAYNLGCVVAGLTSYVAYKNVGPETWFLSVAAVLVFACIVFFSGFIQRICELQAQNNLFDSAGRPRPFMELEEAQHSSRKCSNGGSLPTAP